MTAEQDRKSQRMADTPLTGKENQMKTKIRQTIMALAVTTLMAASTAWGATNQATDPGGGGVTLTASGAVTVNATASALQLVKQVYDASGNCLASQPADAACNSKRPPSRYRPA